jgi:predicted transcriptional regulator
MADTETLSLAAEIVAAHVSNNTIAANELPDLIRSVHAALAATAAPAEPEAAKQEPAVSIRSSIKQDHLVCLEDGKKLKMLKRYLRTNYDMSPDEYRTKWGLPRDYPMVAPAYAEARRGRAQKIGLGRKKVEEAATEVVAAVTKAPRGRKPKTDASAAAEETPAAEPKRRGRPRKTDATSQTEATADA